MSVKNKLTLIFLLFSLTGCSAYSSKFQSKPAKGLYDIPLHDVDELITSDLIDEVIGEKPKVHRSYRLNNKHIGVKNEISR